MIFAHSIAICSGSGVMSLTGADIAATEVVCFVLGKVVLQLLELSQQPVLLRLLSCPICRQVLNEGSGKELLAPAAWSRQVDAT